MKRFFAFALLFVSCIFMLLSCGLSATQIENNLKDEGYTTRRWTEDEIKESFGTLYEKEEYEITAVLEGCTDSSTLIAIQLSTSAQAKDLKSELVTIITDESLEIVVEGRLVLVGQGDDINIALGKEVSTN